MASRKTYFKNFQAFQHDNLGHKQNLYRLARGAYQNDTPESALASALLFASIADYMGVHLLMSLRLHIKSLSQNASGGIVYYDGREVSAANLNRLITALEEYSFPMKSEIIEHMQVIKNARNRLFHEMAMIDPGEIAKLDEDIKLIAENTDSLVNKIDLLYSNFPAADVSGGAANENAAKRTKEKENSAKRN